MALCNSLFLWTVYHWLFSRGGDTNFCKVNSKQSNGIQPPIEVFFLSPSCVTSYSIFTHIHPYSPIFTHVATSLELRTSGSMRSREGETPWGWKWDDRWHGSGQEKSESEEWIDVKVEDEDGWESWSNSRSWERSSQSRHNKYLEKSKGSPEHLQSLCTELTQELGDTTDTPRLQSFQRRLLREAVQYNCWRIRDLDPSVCYLAEWHYGHLIQRIPLHDQRLRGGHAEISARFRHGPHKGQPVQTLNQRFEHGEMQGESLGSISGGEICWFFVGGLWKSQVVRRQKPSWWQFWTWNESFKAHTDESFPPQ